jgi:CheY-like chemotaxis protein
VIDDHRETGEALAHLVRLWGHEARFCDSAVAAFDEAEAFGPDVVLLDLAMPGLSGFEVALLLRKNHRLAKDQIMAVSGLCQDQDKQRALEHGLDGHLSKPVDPELLRRVIDLSPVLSRAPGKVLRLRLLSPRRRRAAQGSPPLQATA